MKVKYIDGNIIVFLNRYIKFELEDIYLEKNLRKIFNKLEKNYNIKIKGYYDIYIYVDRYEIIIEIIKDIDDYQIDYVDMKIITKYVDVLYRLDDIYDIDASYDIYFYKNNIYLDLIDNIEDNIHSNLCEQSEIVYKNIDVIRKNGKIIKEVRL